jgi:hypothetical protein
MTTVWMLALRADDVVSITWWVLEGAVRRGCGSV